MYYITFLLKRKKNICIYLYIPKFWKDSWKTKTELILGHKENLGKWEEEFSLSTVLYLEILWNVQTCFKTHPELVLIRYGKTHRHGNDCHKGINLYSHFPRNRKYNIQGRSKKNQHRSGGRGRERGMEASAFDVFPKEGMGEIG